MLLSAFAAIVMFAAPETAQAGAATAAEAPAATATAEAKPAMRKVCTKMELPGTNLPKKTCKMVPVKPGEKADEQAAAKSEQAKAE
jgi:hypothetical protein